MIRQDVILLRKNLEWTCDDISTWINRPYTRWIALGHFDEIYTYSLDQEGDFFSSIRKDKAQIYAHNDASTYYHPLYLVPDKDCIHAEHNEFGFIAIVRIHFALSQKLSEQFQQLSNALLHDSLLQSMSYQIYYATEFSDMVLDIRSSKFCDLLRTVLTMRKYKQIGKMYTYFGINASCLSMPTFTPEVEDKIPLFSMRFSGSDLSIVIQQMKIVQAQLMRNPEYAVNGVDDVLLFYKDLPTASVVSLYRNWIFGEGNKKIRQSESTTRLGIQISIEQDFTVPEKTDLAPLCRQLLPLRDKIVSRLRETDGMLDDSWFHAVSEISNSLVRMSKSPVMDEVVYLLAPEMEAFLENILFQLDNHCMTPSDILAYYDYVERCTYLLEQLMRIEGQLSQQPEIRPPIYDIPVFMLEYTVAFLNKVSTLLRMTDSRLNKHHLFLLVPRPCDQISAVELFPATQELPGLVQLQIPAKALYTPTDILRALCHEISHYVGEKYRNRELRKKYYARAVAVALSDAVFQSKRHGLVKFLEQTFLCSLDKNREPTIQEMREIIKADTDAIFASADTLAAFLRDCLSFSPEGTRIAFPNKDMIDRGLQRFAGKCDDLDILFREIYADICMLYILNVPTGDYIESLLHELAINSNPIWNCNELFAIRIFVSLTATNKIKAYENNKHRDLWAQIRTLIYHIDEEIHEGTDGTYKLPLPISSVFALLEYAQICYKSISASVKPVHTHEVKEMYACLTRDNFQYKTILDRIEDCRAEMINLSKKV